MTVHDQLVNTTAEVARLNVVLACEKRIEPNNKLSVYYLKKHLETLMKELKRIDDIMSREEY